VTTFFIPGPSDGARATERVYADMRDQIERDTGRRPSGRRILQLWTRRGSDDCVIEVGMSDPLLGGTVMAIFDLGWHQPFVVWRQPEGALDGVRDILGPSAYSVVEFDAEPG
jgi:hypothetical protein